MEVLMFFAIVMLVLVALNVAALRWGVNGRQPWTNANSYDPRSDWQ